jgi:hypothetical protein
VVAVTGWTRSEIARVVAAVRRSALAHHDRPWVLEFHDGGVSLFERLDTRLPHGDLDGRHRLIACGAALTDLRLAVRCLGWGVRWTRFPDPGHSDEVARVIRAGRLAPTGDELDLRRALASRHPHHGSFAPDPLPVPVWHTLMEGLTVPGVKIQSILGKPFAGTHFVLTTPGDGRGDQVLAGAALEEIWLAATRAGLAASAASQPARPAGSLGFPQAVLSVGAVRAGSRRSTEEVCHAR